MPKRTMTQSLINFSNQKLHEGMTHEDISDCLSYVLVLLNYRATGDSKQATQRLEFVRTNFESALTASGERVTIH